MALSYVGIVKATKGVLLGDVGRSVSSRFATREAAARWVKVIADANNRYGRACTGKVYESEKTPEIDA